MGQGFSRKINLFCLILAISMGIPQSSWGGTDRQCDLKVNRMNSITDIWLNSRPEGDNYPHENSNQPIYLAQTIICQRRLSPIILLRRIYNPRFGGCIDLIINIQTGQVLQSRPAPCNPYC